MRQNGNMEANAGQMISHNSMKSSSKLAETMNLSSRLR